MSLGLSSAAGAADFAQWMELGHRSYALGDFVAADMDYLEACLLDGQSADAFYGVAACQIMLGHAASAREYAEWALARGPTEPAVQTLAVRTGIPQNLIQGLALLADNSLESAYALLHQATLEAPDSGLAWRSLAACALALGRLQEALAALDHAAQAEPENRDVGPLRLKIESAFEAFLMKTDPPSYWRRKGVYLFRAGHPGDAARAFEKAVALLPGNADIWFNLAMACWKNGEWTGMGGALKRALALNPRHPGALYLEAVFLRHGGNEREAALQLENLAGAPAGDFSGLAQASLAQWNAGNAAPKHWGVFLRALVGPMQTTSNNGVAMATTRSAASQDYLRLNGDAFSATEHPTDLAYGLYLTPFEPYGGAVNLGSPYQSVELDQHYRPGSVLDTQADYIGGVMDNSSCDLIYDTNAAKLQADLRLGRDVILSVQGQALWERYPDVPAYDALSEIGGLTLVWIGATGTALSLGLSGRNDVAWGSEWSYRNLAANLYGRLMLFKGWSLTATALWQPQVYPYDSDRRYDSIMAAALELAVPLFWKLTGLLGDQYNNDLSSVTLYSSNSDLAYAGLQLSY